MIKNNDQNEGMKDGNLTGKRVRIFVIVLIGVILAGICWWLYTRDRVSTDDAYVMADSATISSRIPGTILTVNVENDDRVAVGDLLLSLDPADYQVKVDEVRASLARIEAEIELSKVSLRLTDDQTNEQVNGAGAQRQAARQALRRARHQLEEFQRKRDAALAEAVNVEKDFKRFTALFHSGAGSERALDAARTAYQKADAALKAANQQIAAARASVKAARENVDQSGAQLNESRASRLRVKMAKHKLSALKAQRSEVASRLKKAELDLSYCAIQAPISGYVAQKRIAVGDRIQPGQPLFAVVPLDQVYVEANFKETQLEDICLGQPAEIKTDACPGYTYHGKVAGIRAGTGAAFSLLPPENATGNWIKIVQRVPVKIRLDVPPPPEHPLRVGFSLDVTVITSDKSGPKLSSTRNENAHP